MVDLFEKVTKQPVLRAAWFKIRSNGNRSNLPETREAVEEFSRVADSQIRQIQKHLRAGDFEFDPQKGIVKRKPSGGGRGIVMASVRNRIVERALLDVLVSDVPFVSSVVNFETSVGGVPDRSVPRGLALVMGAMQECPWFVRSDISGFFTGIPRDKVIGKIAEHVNDERF